MTAENNNLDLINLDERALNMETLRAEITVKREQAALLEAQARYEDACTKVMLREG